MEVDIQERLKVLEEKTDAILHSVQKTQRYFQVTLWITIVLFVVPLILLVFAIPAVLNSYLGTLNGGENEIAPASDLNTPGIEELMQGLL